MTVKAGIAHNGKVYMASDRGMSDKGFIGSILTPKIRKVGPLLIGYSGSQGAGQLAHNTIYPEPNYNNLEAWIRFEFADALQKTAEQFKIDINTEENGTDLLVGVGGRIFEVTTEDWAASEYKYIATGSGYAYAIGSLFSTQDWEDQKARVKEAVKASIAHSPTCTGPIDTLIV
jgi:20S proteasome alpha/beta subunit